MVLNYNKLRIVFHCAFSDICFNTLMVVVSPLYYQLILVTQVKYGYLQLHYVDFIPNENIDDVKKIQAHFKNKFVAYREIAKSHPTFLNQLDSTYKIVAI